MCSENLVTLAGFILSFAVLEISLMKTIYRSSHEQKAVIIMFLKWILVLYFFRTVRKLVAQIFFTQAMVYTVTVME